MTRARIQRGRGPSVSPLTLQAPGSAQRDGVRDQGPSWPGGRAPTRSPGSAPGRRGGPAAPRRRRRRRSLRSATAASTGRGQRRVGSAVVCRESLTVSVCVSPLHSVGEEDQNGVKDPGPGEGPYPAACAGPVNGSADAEC